MKNIIKFVVAVALLAHVVFGETKVIKIIKPVPTTNWSKIKNLFN